MFELENPEDRIICVSLHMEQVYTILCKNIDIGERTGCFKANKVTESCIENLQRIQYPAGKEDYDLVVDCSNISCIEQKHFVKFKKWLEGWRTVKICNCMITDEKQKNEIKEYDSASSEYIKEFNLYGKRYIESICLKKHGYTTQTGVKLGVYINIKSIIEDTKEMFRWCYMLAYKLDKDIIYKRKYRSTGKAVLFCHTLNGANIASLLSQLLNLDIIFVDHLGPYNKLNTINFYKDIYSPRECIIVVDMICQGNEILRAKNIIEYLGGTVKGFIGIVNLELSNLASKNDIDAFAITFSPDEARRNLHYTIKTKLCNEDCNVKEG